MASPAKLAKSGTKEVSPSGGQIPFGLPVPDRAAAHTGEGNER